MNCPVYLLSYEFLDLSLTIFHDLFTIWNVLGWIYPPFRKLHFYTIVATLFSWLVLGYFYGIGYCIITDIHYTVKECLGYTNLPPSYIQLRIQEISSYLPPLGLTNLVIGVLFTIVSLLSFYFQYQNYSSKRDSK